MDNRVAGGVGKPADRELEDGARDADSIDGDDDDDVDSCDYDQRIDPENVSHAHDLHYSTKLSQKDDFIG